MGSKISIAEAILLLGYIGMTDLVGFLLIFIGLDDFFLLDLLTFPVTQFYFRIKGVRAGFDLAMNAAELIPYVGFLPLRTLGVAYVIWKDRHQKTGQAEEEAVPKFVPAFVENSKFESRNSKQIQKI